MQSTNKSISQQIYTKIQMYSIKYYLRYIKSKVLWETIYDKFFIQETIKKFFINLKKLIILMKKIHINCLNFKKNILK